MKEFFPEIKSVSRRTLSGGGFAGR